MSTPPLPPWIREARVDGYATAHALLPDETRVYGTESLYGDWGGRVLLLAKDFAPSRILHARRDRGDPRPYRHESRMGTNIRLARFADSLRTGPTAGDCGLLYGSALANLLREDGAVSGPLPSRDKAMAYGTKVLKFVLSKMPNLETIVSMGEDAWEATASCLGRTEGWAEMRDRERGLRVDGLDLLVVFHPAARKSIPEHTRLWQRVVAART